MAEWGGIFAILVFVHFLVDWVFQSHYEAMNKAKHWDIRFIHCMIYSSGLCGVMWSFGMLREWPLAIAFLILFVSHFVEDTYVPVFLWAKHLRRIPELRHGTKEDQRKAFKRMFSEPLGVVLFITIDQVIHLTFLWPIVWLIVR